LVGRNYFGKEPKPKFFPNLGGELGKFLFFFFKVVKGNFLKEFLPFIFF